jgi:surfactin synthase thioesterase subunit
VFRRCQEYDSTQLRICPVQLPGREDRFDDPPHTELRSAVNDLLPTLLTQVAGSPALALFGHCLGAVLAYEAARRLSAIGRPEVMALFVSGAPAPLLPRERRATGLSDAEFLARIQEFAGYAHPAFEHPELREMLLPLLRADVRMHETYQLPSAEPLSVPIIVIRGSDDELVSRDQAAGWAAATTAECRHAELSGAHMYLTDHPDDLVRLLESELSALGLRP